MDKQLEETVKFLLQTMRETIADSSVSAGDAIPVGISNRHVHLSQENLTQLFGAGYALNKLKDLSQPGQFACKETVTIAGPKGAIERIRILGPVRKATQVEILAGDSFKLGISVPIRMSGQLAGTPGITIIGPEGSVQTTEGVIVAQRHIHMHTREAERFAVKDGDVVNIECSGERGGILRNVAIRANDTSTLECHLDTEEANALGIRPGSTVRIYNK